LTNPQSHYGATKLEAEKLILQSKKNIVLRTTVIYGWHIRSRFTNWVLSSLEKNQQIPAFTDQKNTPTLVSDISYSVLELIRLNKSGLFNAVGKTCLSRYDFAILLAEKFGFDTKNVIPTLSSIKKQLAPRPKNGCLNAKNLEEEINFNFKTIEEGISLMHDEFLRVKQFPYNF